MWTCASQWQGAVGVCCAGCASTEYRGKNVGQKQRMASKPRLAMRRHRQGLACFRILEGKAASSRKRRLKRFMSCMASAVAPFCMRSRKVWMKMGYRTLRSSGCRESPHASALVVYHTRKNEMQHHPGLLMLPLQGQGQHRCLHSTPHGCDAAQNGDRELCSRSRPAE